MSPGVARVLVVADGRVPPRSTLDLAWPGWADGLGLTVAADGGARKAEAVGFCPDVVVGDGDSLDPADLARFRAAGAEIEAWPAEKDFSDLELALRRALAAEPRGIVILGALGGLRLDHELVNLGLLAGGELTGRDVIVLDGSTRIRLLAGPGRVDLRGRPGDLVTLVPFGGPIEGVTTEGLRYPLRDEALAPGSSRGLSNERQGEVAAVSLRAGCCWIVETHQGPEPSGHEGGRA